ncbi:MAG TPA: SRPBCC family protein [Actinocrinis sp.]|nr:SRPBCC family protein [Actinocrinis sp.]
MPEFELSAPSRAPVEEVWKLLFDPARFPDWWVGIESVHEDAPGRYTLWPTGYPDFPMPQKLRTDRVNGRVTVSCQVSDISFVWQLAEAGAGTSIQVRVSLPEREAHRLDGQQRDIKESLARLAVLAEAASESSSESVSR